MNSGQFTTRKYAGDDIYSWAVFRKKDLPAGHRGIVFYGQATPICSGMSRTSAQYTARDLAQKKL